MKERINNKYKDIEKIFEEIKANLSIEETVILKIEKTVGNGDAKKSRQNFILTIDKSIVNDYENEDNKERKELLTNVIKFLIGHELAHIKYKDPSLLENLRAIFSKKLQAISIIKELRADIEGSSAAGLSKSECKEVHDYLEKLDDKYSKRKTYALGYPMRTQRADITSKYNVFNKDSFGYIIEHVIKDFCKTMKINNQEKFIENLREEFFKELA